MMDANMWLLFHDLLHDTTLFMLNTVWLGLFGGDLDYSCGGAIVYIHTISTSE